MTHARPTIDFDFSSADYADHWQERYAELRSRCPVAYTPNHGGFWLVSSYDEVRRVAHDPATFSSDHDPHNEREGYRGVGIPVSVGTRSLPQEADPPAALFYRRAMNPLFKPAAAAEWEPWLAALTHRILDEALPTGGIDLADELGFPVPARFIVALLGLPDGDWRWLVDPFHTLVTTPADDPRHPRAVEQLSRVLDVLRETIAKRRAAPGRDLISTLVTADVQGRALGDDEVLSMAQLVLFGGVDSTTAVFTNAALWLADHPEQADRLRADPRLLDNAAEEFLRYYSPIHLNGRTVTRDTELGGCALGAGDRLLISWAAANHDPRAIEDPGTINLDRATGRHLSFGAGVHHCLGAHYARTMLTVLVSAVLERIPHYRVDAAGVARYPSVGQVNGYEHLPVTFTPRPVHRPARPLPSPWR